MSYNLIFNKVRHVLKTWFHDEKGAVRSGRASGVEEGDLEIRTSLEEGFF